jgi:hypothetical protein
MVIVIFFVLSLDFPRQAAGKSFILRYGAGLGFIDRGHARMNTRFHGSEIM